MKMDKFTHLILAMAMAITLAACGGGGGGGVGNNDGTPTPDPDPQPDPGTRFLQVEVQDFQPEATGRMAFRSVEVESNEIHFYIEKYDISGAVVDTIDVDNVADRMDGNYELTIRGDINSGDYALVAEMPNGDVLRSPLIGYTVQVNPVTTSYQSKLVTSGVDTANSDMKTVQASISQLMVQAQDISTADNAIEKELGGDIQTEANMATMAMPVNTGQTVYTDYNQVTLGIELMDRTRPSDLARTTYVTTGSGYLEDKGLDVNLKLNSHRFYGVRTQFAKGYTYQSAQRGQDAWNGTTWFESIRKPNGDLFGKLHLDADLMDRNTEGSYYVLDGYGMFGINEYVLFQGFAYPDTQSFSELNMAFEVNPALSADDIDGNYGIITLTSGVASNNTETVITEKFTLESSYGTVTDGQIDYTVTDADSLRYTRTDDAVEYVFQDEPLESRSLALSIVDGKANFVGNANSGGFVSPNGGFIIVSDKINAPMEDEDYHQVLEDDHSLTFMLKSNPIDETDLDGKRYAIAGLFSANSLPAGQEKHVEVEVNRLESTVINFDSDEVEATGFRRENSFQIRALPYSTVASPNMEAREQLPEYAVSNVEALPTGEITFKAGGLTFTGFVTPEEDDHNLMVLKVTSEAGNALGIAIAVIR